MPGNPFKRGDHARIRRGGKVYRVFDVRTVYGLGADTTERHQVRLMAPYGAHRPANSAKRAHDALHWHDAAQLLPVVLDAR